MYKATLTKYLNTHDEDSFMTILFLLYMYTIIVTTFFTLKCATLEFASHKRATMPSEKHDTPKQQCSIYSEYLVLDRETLIRRRHCYIPLNLANVYYIVVKLLTQLTIGVYLLSFLNKMKGNRNV